MNSLLNTQSYAAMAVFITGYVLFVFLPTRRGLVSMSAVGVLLLVRVVPLSDLAVAVNWNVMGIFVGSLVLSELFAYSRVPAIITERILNRVGSIRMALILICAITGVISAFVENVATLLIVAPIVLTFCKRVGISPVKPMVAIAVSSNLQGTATLIGDPPSMILAAYNKMDFFDFFFFQGKLGIFFVVQVGAIASLAYLAWVFRKGGKMPHIMQIEKVQTWAPSIFLGILIGGLSIASFAKENGFAVAGLFCLIMAGVGLAWYSTVRKESLVTFCRNYDWDTTFFLLGVFVLVYAITSTGWIQYASNLLSACVGQNALLAFVVIGLFSVMVSAFVDNVPYVLATLPIASQVAQTVGVDPTLFVFALVIASCVGGNITPLGASANIVAFGALRREGVTHNMGDFVKLGLPFTIISVSAALAFLWLLF